MTDTDTDTETYVAALRVLSPAGRSSAVDRALAAAERLDAEQRERLSALDDCLVGTPPTSPASLVGGLLDGTTSAADVVAAATRPVLDQAAGLALLEAAERAAARRLDEAVRAAADLITPEAADKALATPWEAAQKASRTLAGLLDQHGLRDHDGHVDPAAVLRVPAAATAWAEADAAVRLALDVAAAVAVVDGDPDVLEAGGPTAQLATAHWWAPTAGDVVARASTMARWDPSTVPALPLLPVAADEAGVRLAYTDYAVALQRTRVWARVGAARRELDLARQRARAYDRPEAAELASDPRASAVVAAGRQLDDGLGTPVPSTGRRGRSTAA